VNGQAIAERAANYISQEPAGDDPPDEKIVDAQNNVLVPPYVLGAPQYAC
jgi:hypothetical protein